MPDIITFSSCNSFPEVRIFHAMGALEKIIGQAKSGKRRIVLPEAGDPRVCEAAQKAVDRGLADVILIAGTDSKAARSSDAAEVIDPATHDAQERYIDSLVARRSRKGMTHALAQAQIREPLVYAAMMVAEGDADGCVAGAATATADVVRTALQLIGTAPETRLVSSFFIMEYAPDHEPLSGTALFADCALVISPDAGELAEIAITTALSAQSLVHIDPTVALLSFSTAGSARHALVDRVIEAGRIIRAQAPDLKLMSEVQFDAAIVPDVLHAKAPHIGVDVPANVFIFPDLQSGNIGYKIAQRLGGLTAVGPILQGLERPMNDLSRGCSVEDIVQLIAVTSVQSQGNPDFGCGSND